LLSFRSRITYYLQIARKLNARKAANLLLLRAGYYLSRAAGKPFQIGMPFTMSIEPTTSCNLRCPECPSGLRAFSRPTGMLNETDFRNVVDQAAPHLHTLTLYFQGEPYLNPSLTDMISHASAKGIYTITSTNAHYLSPAVAKQTVLSGLDKLIISVDGVTQESYSKYRIGGQVEKVIESTRHMVDEKRKANSRTPHIVWQFVVFRHNEHEVPLVKKLGRELGVDEVKIKTAQVYDTEKSSDLIPLEGNYARYSADEAGTYSINNSLGNKCWRMWQGCVVTWDGKIVPCCFDKDASHHVGSLKTQRLAEVWHSSAFNRFRRSVLLGRKEIDICANCSEGSRVWV
jgi:radical SAM protein with 4Fe4S-binding SPASM domain